MADFELLDIGFCVTHSDVVDYGNPTECGRKVYEGAAHACDLRFDRLYLRVASNRDRNQEEYDRG